MLRVISELRPAWVVGENVAGIVNMALDQVYADLENEGYAVQAFIIPACAVDAPHRRDKCAILAHSNGGRQLYRETEKHPAETGKHAQREPIGRSTNVADAESAECERKRRKAWKRRPEPGCCCDDVSDADNGSRLVRRDGEFPAVEETGESRTDHGGGAQKYVSRQWWPAEPNVRRVVNGVPNRVDRLKCLGNAVVPQQFYPIFQAIADIERGDYTWMTSN